jgi:23S rRNA A1618 N6-methylase RlmF
MLTTYSAGLATVAGGGSDSQIAWLDVGIGAVCIGIIPGREERYKMHLRQAVELYNDALEIPEN